MFDIRIFENLSTEEKYNEMVTMLEALMDPVENIITNLSNASSIMGALISEINWCGFYIAKSEELYLGPFQGMPACTRIPFGKGVCGTAALAKETIVVEDVNVFQDHITCDNATSSEIVVPIIKNNEVVAVIDVDSFKLNRFTETEKVYLEKCAKILSEKIEWKRLTAL